MTEALQGSGQHETAYYWPNKMGRLFLLALEDVMGPNGVNAVLTLARVRYRVNNYPPNDLDMGFGFHELSATIRALEEMYGPRGGRNLAIRAGRAGFQHGLREFGSLLGLADLAFRLLPLELKLKVGIYAMSDTFNRLTEQRVRVAEERDSLVCHIDRCPVCWDRHAETPCCHAVRGFLEEMAYWVSGGSSFDVKEVACIAAGDQACTFVVPKRASRGPLKIDDETGRHSR